MADPLGNVSPGDGAGRLLNAQTFNMTMESVRAFRNGRGAPGGVTGVLQADETPSRLDVRVKAASTIQERAVVGLGEPLIDPAAKPLNALNTPVFESVSPTASGPFGIATTAIATDRIGRVTVIGVCVASVELTDVAHKFAKPEAGNDTSLVSAESGPVQILQEFEETGTYTTSVLLLGSSGGEGDGGGGEGGGDGSGWVAALTNTDCLRVGTISQSGDCDCSMLSGYSPVDVLLTSTDGKTWLSGTPVTICGSNYTVAYEKNNCGPGCLTLTGNEFVWPIKDPECCPEEPPEEIELIELTIDGIRYIGGPGGGEPLEKQDGMVWEGTFTVASPIGSECSNPKIFGGATSTGNFDVEMWYSMATSPDGTSFEWSGTSLSGSATVEVYTGPCGGQTLVTSQNADGTFVFFIPPGVTLVYWKIVAAMASDGVTFTVS